MSPALNSCASAAAALRASASAKMKRECLIVCPLLALASRWRSWLHGEFKGSLGVMRIDRDGLPVHFISASRQGFGDRHDQDGLIAGFRVSRTERHGAAWASHGNLREFRFDALAELKSD